MSLRIEHDPEADPVYIPFRVEPHAFVRDLGDARGVDFGPDGQSIGIGPRFVSHGVDIAGLPQEDTVARLLEEHGFRVLFTGRAEAASPDPFPGRVPACLPRDAPPCAGPVA